MKKVLLCCLAALLLIGMPSLLAQPEGRPFQRLQKQVDTQQVQIDSIEQVVEDLETDVEILKYERRDIDSFYVWFPDEEYNSEWTEIITLPQGTAFIITDIIGTATNLGDYKYWAGITIRHDYDGGGATIFHDRRVVPGNDRIHYTYHFHSGIRTTYGATLSVQQTRRGWVHISGYYYSLDGDS